MSIAARTANRSAAPASGRQASTGRLDRDTADGAVDWERRLRPQSVPKVVADPRQGDRLLVPTPLMVARAIAEVRPGQVITLTDLRLRLAARTGADRACPLATGKAIAAIAGAVTGDLKAHRKPRWPIWRVVRDDGVLQKHWALDLLYRAALLREEGLRVTRCNGTWRVLNAD